MTLRLLAIILFCIMFAGCNAGTHQRDEIGRSREAILPAVDPININSASIEELQRIPHVGASIAEKIIEHREKYGPFKRPEHLMLIQGMSDIRFRRIRHLIRVE